MFRHANLEPGASENRGEPRGQCGPGLQGVQQAGHVFLAERWQVDALYTGVPVYGLPCYSHTPGHAFFTLTIMGASCRHRCVDSNAPCLYFRSKGRPAHDLDVPVQGRRGRWVDGHGNRCNRWSCPAGNCLEGSVRCEGRSCGRIMI
ncbi:hypothetical protein E2C01_078130 [Portunus trituberculatus]|uniref:Uncharacterized protein n=1 Tax=Portunus trituberculatus TaxID=210409 RepID=A0A5B7ID64_PORTR|nr:hypothetical protein [Portunus trituberculatus]